MIKDVDLKNYGAVLYEVRQYRYRVPFPSSKEPGKVTAMLMFQVDILEFETTYGIGRVFLTGGDGSELSSSMLKCIKDMDDLYYANIGSLGVVGDKDKGFKSLSSVLQAAVNRIDYILEKIA
jgi:hypothetical protein